MKTITIDVSMGAINPFCSDATFSKKIIKNARFPFKDTFWGAIVKGNNMSEKSFIEKVDEYGFMMDDLPIGESLYFRRDIPIDGESFERYEFFFTIVSIDNYQLKLINHSSKREMERYSKQNAY